MADPRFRDLLVDDEPDFVEALAARMETRGWLVEKAGSGSEALEKASDPEFDAILLDLAMPGMDGIETLRRILALDPLHQVIILTGHATLEKGMEAIQLGALDVLEKPVPLAVLMDKVQEAAQRKRRMAETRPPPPKAEKKPAGRARAVPVLHRVFPFLTWIKECRGEALRADLLSGLTVALVLIPQSMAYAQLAGLPAYYGLYAAFLPPTIAALFGSSRQLATGPVAVVSLMTSAALEPLATAGSKEYVTYAILLALLVGLFQLALGLLRLGLVVNFLSHPVVNGFTNAAALIIATSQLASVFGVEVEKGHHHYETVYRVAREAAVSTHWPTLGMAALAFAIMIGLKKVSPRVPNVLVAVALTTLLAWAFHFSRRAEAPLSSLPEGEVRDRILAFNEAVSERQEMESFRTAMNKRLETLFGPGQKVCLSCHEERSAKRFDSGDAREAGAPPREVLLLHHRAALVDARIAELKEEEEGLRTALRGLTFERDASGLEAFYLQGGVPQGRRGDGGRWKLKVGNKPLDETAVPLAGGGAVVGKIPKGLPKPSVPSFSLAVALKVLPVAMIISILGFMEAISIAKAMAAKSHHRLDPNQELVGQGLANAAGSFFQSYAVSGSFSRSAVNFQSGAVTGLSSAFSSVVVVLTLFFFTPLLYHLPQAVLAAIIMMAVVGLLNVKGFVHAWKAQWFDGFTAVAAFCATLYFAPHLEWGILSGVALSLGAYLYRTMHPHVAELSLHADGSLRDAERHGLKQCGHIAAIRFDGPLNFASCSYLEEEILARVSEMPKLRHVLIVAHAINELDASGEEMLEKIVHRLRAGGVRVSFSGLKDSVIDVLRRTRLYDKIGEEHMYPTQLIAIQQIYESAHVGSDEVRCPLLARPAQAKGPIGPAPAPDAPG
jgi:MFS superfamily sulfate permease-like transporter/CheY-like chemotaxis protein